MAFKESSKTSFLSVEEDSIFLVLSTMVTQLQICSEINDLLRFGTLPKCMEKEI